MTKSTEAESLQLGQLIDEFTARVRAGERPKIEDYALKHPLLAGDIRELFPTLLTMEFAGVQVSAGGVTPSGQKPERLGEYRILREIGRGGMGVVYEAEQESLGRHVALKVLPFHAFMEPKHLTRFHREARAVAQLHHSHIVPVFGVGEHEGMHYYAMQFIRGMGLDLVLDEMRSLNDQTANASPSQFASAIGSRPVGAKVESSENAISNHEIAPVDDDLATAELSRHQVSSEVTVASISTAASSSASMSGHHLYKNVARIGSQIADALACAHAQGVLHRDIKPSNIMIDTSGNAWVTDFGLAKTLEEGLTHTGDLVGTLRYMSPERFRGWSDPRSDIYSLGLTLYEMLTLRPAVKETDRAEIIHSVLHATPTAPRQIDVRIPRDLETIVLKSIAKEPYARYQSAAELVEDLQRFVSDKPIVARRTPMLQHLWLWCRRNPMAAGLSAVVGLLLILLTTSSVLYAVQVQRSMSQMREAEHILNVANRRGEEHLFDSYVAQARAVRRTRQPGQRVESLLAISKAAELMRKLGRTEEWRAKLRDDTIASLALVDVQIDRSWPGDQYGERSSHMRWAIDAQAERYARELQNGAVAVYSMHDNRELMRFSSQPHQGTDRPYFEFSNDGRYLGQFLVTQDGEALVQLFDLVDQRPYFEQPQPSIGEAFWQHIAFSRDSRLFVYQDNANYLQIVDIANRTTRSIRLTQRAVFISLSPDNQFVAVDDQYKTLMVVDLATGKVANRFVHPSEVNCATWSNDGRMLAAACGNGNLYVWNVADATRPLAKCVGHRGSVRNVAFNSNATLVSTSWDQTTRLWDAPSGAEVMRLDFFGGRRFSNDDQWLGFEYAGHEIGRAKVIGGQACRILTGLNDFGHSVIQGLSFSSDSRLLASTSGRELAIWDTESGECRERNTTYGNTSGVTFHSTLDELFVCGGTTLDRWSVVRDESTRNFVRLDNRQSIFKSSLDLCPTARLSQNNTVFVAEVMTGRGHILDVRNPNEVVEIVDNDWLNNPDISPDGKWAACGSWKTGHWSVWDTATGEEVVRRETRLDGAAVNFSPDGKWLIVCEADLVNFVRVSDWQQQFTVQREQPGFANIAISPDMKLMAISEMTYLKLYDFSTRELLARIRGPVEAQLSTSHPTAAALCFSPDGNFLAVGTFHDATQLWNLQLVRTQLAQLGLDWN